MNVSLQRSLRAAARDRRAGFFLDFDGTLSEIVGDPAAARPVRGARGALRALSDAGARVVVLSGRPAAFLSRVIAVPGVTYAGLYGAQERVGRATWEDPAVAGIRPSVAAAIVIFRRELHGLHIEDKGHAVAVHARRARDPEAALRAAVPVVRAVAHDLGLSPIARGRLVLEVGARGAPTKGSTLARICVREKLRRAVAIGDDAGDLAMFQAARTSTPRAMAIWVSNPEAPRTLRAAADLTVGSPLELVALLRDIAD